MSFAFKLTLCYFALDADDFKFLDADGSETWRRLKASDASAEKVNTAEPYIRSPAAGKTYWRKYRQHERVVL